MPLEHVVRPIAASCAAADYAADGSREGRKRRLAAHPPQANSPPECEKAYFTRVSRGLSPKGSGGFFISRFPRGGCWAGAEEAGMKGWRGRSRIPPEGAKARFTRVSRGLAPQVSSFSFAR